MDFQLSDEQRLISEAAREFADKEIAPRVRRTTARRASTASWRASWARSATWARRSPKSTAAAASTTSATG